MMMYSLAIRLFLLILAVLQAVTFAASTGSDADGRPRIIMEGHPGDRPIVIHPQYNQFAPRQGQAADQFGEKDLLLLKDLGYGIKKLPDGTFEAVPLPKTPKHRPPLLQHSPKPWVGILPPLPPKSSGNNGTTTTQGDKTINPSAPTTPQAAPQAVPEPVVKPNEASSTGAPGVGVNGTNKGNSSAPETGVPGFVFPPGPGKDNNSNVPTPNAASSGSSSTTKSPDGTSDSGVQGPTASSRPSSHDNTSGNTAVGSVGSNATRPPSSTSGTKSNGNGAGKKTNEQPSYLIGILMAVVVGLILIVIL